LSCFDCSFFGYSIANIYNNALKPDKIVRNERLMERTVYNNFGIIKFKHDRMPKIKIIQKI